MLLRIISTFWIIAKLISINLWLDDRLYPLVPLFEYTETIPSIVHTLLFYSSITVLFSVLLFPKNIKLIILLLLLELSSCILDVTRWQPWEYQYIFILLIFILNRNNSRVIYNALIFILASIYIYSGFHKVNGGFLYTIWEQMMLRNFMGISNKTIIDNKLHYVGLILPVIEILSGFGLLFLKNKRTPALVLITMHLFILLFIGPLGINHNMVVWPWNVAMIALLYILFIKNSTLEYSLKTITKKWNLIVLLFWGILPAFSFIGYWEHYLSSSLYSGNTVNMSICFKDKEDAKLFEPYLSNKDRYNVCNGESRLSLLHWAYTEMRVTPYPEVWYYKRFKEQYIKQYGKDKVRFIRYCYPYKELKEVE
ncbi:MAG: hypothetical protein BM557_07235 [Flavobacterium sp. MedPE-SWcel]|uniref:hypothetical protein n=1 Tax=uncultured Flavobacterium sp. TaxID=165435 RepID=UPI00091A64CD|nr:hypothetical protein [uncultured Flavobacterium sp.]OIQ18706.1 MAG: hypothetical protein BM557_07235 [Flavobacterium sp. MedPE-SWcel]